MVLDMFIDYIGEYIGKRGFKMILSGKKERDIPKKEKVCGWNKEDI